MAHETMFHGRRGEEKPWRPGEKPAGTQAYTYVDFDGPIPGFPVFKVKE